MTFFTVVRPFFGKLHEGNETEETLTVLETEAKYSSAEILLEFKIFCKGKCIDRDGDISSGAVC